MMNTTRKRATWLLAAWLLPAAGLLAQDPHAGHGHGPGEGHEEEEPMAPPGMIAIPQGVRDNLGITFATVERRVVQETMRLPGRFELAPHARTEHRAGARGRVELLARQYEPVAPGDLLFRLESTRWAELQRELAEAELAARMLAPREQATTRAREAAEQGVQVWRERLARLRELRESGAAQAPQIAEASAALAEAEGRLAEALAREQELAVEAFAVRDAGGANARFQVALREAATIMGCEEGWLLEDVEGRPRWQALRALEVRARRAGVASIVAVADGGLVQEGDLVVEVIDPAAVRFRGFALQADISMIQDGASVRIVPPHGGIASYTEVVEATMRLGTEADPDERTIDLVATPTTGDLPAWARPGVAAFVEVVTRGWGDSELAIPLGAVATDGLERVFFLRDREDPDQVRRVVADLGADDGRWVVVNSGLRPGDEVVLSGVYELRLTGSGKEQQGGHFHSDGSFHEAEH